MALTIVILLVLGEVGSVFVRFAAKVVDDDTALYWFADHDFAAGHLREPLYYGQTYYTLFESALAAPLVRLGASDAYVLPATCLALMAVSWLLLAAIAWRRNQILPALLLAAIPVLLPLPYLLIASKPYLEGVAVVAGAAALGTFTERRWAAVGAGALLPIGVLMNPNSLFLAAAVLAWLTVEHRFDRAYLGHEALGVACGIALDATARVYYVVNPARVLVPALNLDWKAATLVSNLRHLDHFFSGLIPAPFDSWPPSLLLLPAGLALFCAIHGDWPAMAVGAVCLAGGLAVLGFPKLMDGDGTVFFSTQRMLLGLPAAVGLGVAVTNWPRIALPRGAGPAAITAVAAIATAAHLAHLQPAIQADGAPRPGITNPRTVASMDIACAKLDSASRRTGIDLVVVLVERSIAWACGGVDYGRYVTLFPAYERRSWLMSEEGHVNRTAALFVDADDGFCPAAMVAGATRCQYVDRSLLLVSVRFPSQSVLTFWRRTAAIEAANAPPTKPST